MVCQIGNRASNVAMRMGKHSTSQVIGRNFTTYTAKPIKNFINSDRVASYLNWVANAGLVGCAVGSVWGFIDSFSDRKIDDPFFDKAMKITGATIDNGVNVGGFCAMLAAFPPVTLPAAWYWYSTKNQK